MGSGGTTLMVSVPAGDVATAGLISVTVTNAAPGGGTSGLQTFTVNNPAPTMTQLSPTKRDYRRSGIYTNDHGDQLRGGSYGELRDIHGLGTSLDHSHGDYGADPGDGHRYRRDDQRFR